jgi:hypothetical protein
MDWRMCPQNPEDIGLARKIFWNKDLARDFRLAIGIPTGKILRNKDLALSF